MESASHVLNANPISVMVNVNNVTSAQRKTVLVNVHATNAVIRAAAESAAASCVVVVNVGIAVKTMLST